MEWWVVTLKTESRFFLVVFGITLTSCQAAFQLLGHVLIAVLAHWPQVNLNKLISELPQTQQAYKDKWVEKGQTEKSQIGTSRGWVKHTKNKSVRTGHIGRSRAGRCGQNFISCYIYAPSTETFYIPLVLCTTFHVQLKGMCDIIRTLLHQTVLCICNRDVFDLSRKISLLCKLNELPDTEGNSLPGRQSFSQSKL